MKKKLTIILAVCLFVVIFATTFVACKDKTKGTDYGELYSYMFDKTSGEDADGFKYSALDVSALNALYKDEAVSVSAKDNGIYFIRKKDTVDVYSLVAGKVILNDMDENIDYSGIFGDEPKFIIDEKNNALYDCFGGKICEYGADVSVIDGNRNTFYLYSGGEKIKETRYEKYVVTIEKDKQKSEKTFTVQNDNGIIKAANSVTEKDEKKDPTVGGKLEKERENLSEIFGTGYENYFYSEYYTGDYNVIVISDKDGKTIAKTLVPGQYDASLAHEGKILYTYSYKVPETATDYTYYDETSKLLYKVEHYVADILTGSLTKIDFNYSIENIHMAEKFEEKDGVVYRNVLGVIVEVKEYQNGKKSEQKKVVELDGNFGVKADLTATLGAYDLSKIIKIAADKYIINANDEQSAAIVDANLENEITLGAEVCFVDLVSQRIIVKYDGKYGILDYDGKVVVKPEYSEIGNINGGRATVKDRESKDMIINLSNGSVAVELGDKYDEDGNLVSKTREFVNGTYETRTVRYLGVSGDLSKAYVEVKVKNRSDDAVIATFNTTYANYSTVLNYRSVKTNEKEYYVVSAEEYAFNPTETSMEAESLGTKIFAIVRTGHTSVVRP